MSTTAGGLRGLSPDVDPEVDPKHQSDHPDQHQESKDSQPESRTYHAFEEEAYSLPNDATEHRRLDLQDQVWKLTLKDGLHIAPLPAGIKHVVDIGAGTGKWVVDFARAHPDCHVTGTDLSPIKLDEAPSNVSFTIANANEDWNFQGQKLDFIHSRLILLGLKDWNHYFQQCFTHLAPGGWMEVQELRQPVGYVDDGGVTTNNPFYLFTKLMLEALAKQGIDAQEACQFKEMVEAIGFTNVRYEIVKWPIGPWAVDPVEKEMGRLMALDMIDLYPALASKLIVGVLKWSEEDANDLVKGALEEINDPSKHYYWVVTVCCAQKPIET